MFLNIPDRKRSYAPGGAPGGSRAGEIRSGVRRERVKPPGQGCKPGGEAAGAAGTGGGGWLSGAAEPEGRPGGASAAGQWMGCRGRYEGAGCGCWLGVAEGWRHGAAAAAGRWLGFSE